MRSHEISWETQWDSEKLNEIFKKIFVRVTLYARPTAPWFDTEYHLVRVRTRRLEKAFRRKKDPSSELEWRDQFRLQRDLFQTNFRDCLATTIGSCGGDIKSMWRRLCPLLQLERNPVANHSANEFAAFFARKVENIRSSTASAPPPDITHRFVQDPLFAFDPVTVEELTLLMLQRNTAASIQSQHGWSRRSTMLLHQWLLACAMHNSKKAFYRTNRREQSQVLSSRNRCWIHSISTRIGRFRTSVLCRRWSSELLIVGLSPTRTRTTWPLNVNRRTVATTPRKQRWCNCTMI